MSNEIAEVYDSIVSDYGASFKGQMKRLKRTQFWGENDDDDRLILQIIEGKKTATACPKEEYFLSDGEFEDGGFVVGDLVEVYDLKSRL